MVVLEQVELMRPRRRRNGDVERSVAGEAERPCVLRDGIADDIGPCGCDLGERDCIAAAAPRELALDLIANAVHHSARPGVTDSDCVGDTGSAASAVAVTTVCALRAITSARARRRFPSSSDSTSSRRTSGESVGSSSEQLGLGQHEGQHRDALLPL